MRIRTIVISAVGFFIVTAFLLVGAFQALELRASNRLLDAIRDVQPGMDIEELKEKYDDVRLIAEGDIAVYSSGTVKDEEFCKGKKLYQFCYSTPTCRMVEIYTDRDDRVVFVSWIQL